jgi:hypothetical protein
LFPLFATCVIDTSGICGKFAAGVVATGGIHLDLQISPQILGEDDSRKKPEVKKSPDPIPLMLSEKHVLSYLLYFHCDQTRWSVD